MSWILSRVGFPEAACAGPKCAGATLTISEPLTEKFSGNRSSTCIMSQSSRRMHRPVSFCVAS
eukprot:14631352-Alexandrium_andersonii.AAC.1